MGKESISPYGFCSAPKDYRKSANSRRSAKRSRIEISPPNCQLRGEVPDTTIANYQLRSDTFEIRPDFQSLLTLFPKELDCFREKIQESEDDCDSEWEPDDDSDDCSEPESDDDGNALDAFDNGL